jgi:hypothetical protein
MLWSFDFYSVGGSGTCRGSETISPGSPQMGLKEAIQQARGMMTAITFTFGHANRCLLTSDDRSIVKEVISYERTH